MDVAIRKSTLRHVHVHEGSWCWGVKWQYKKIIFVLNHQERQVNTPTHPGSVGNYQNRPPAMKMLWPLIPPGSPSLGLVVTPRWSHRNALNALNTSLWAPPPPPTAPQRNSVFIQRHHCNVETEGDKLQTLLTKTKYCIMVQLLLTVLMKWEITNQRNNFNPHCPNRGAPWNWGRAAKTFFELWINLSI